VKEGVVTLTGNAPTEEDKQKVETKVKKLPGVKEVVNQLTVAPVVLDGDHALKQSVDSVLKKYPTVTASVQDSVITLEGSANSKNAQKLFNAMQHLKAKGMINQLVINSK
jgi:osmotically-inducible protein OsmY